MFRIIIALLLLSTQASAFSVGFSSNAGGVPETVNMDLSLDESTSFHSSGQAGMGGVSSGTSFSGNGSNEIVISTEDRFVKTISNDVSTSGQIITNSGNLAGSVVQDGIEMLSMSDSTDVMMSANALYDPGSSKVAGLITGPAITETGGNPDAYALMGYRWNTKDPQIKLVLKDDAKLAGEGISIAAASNAIAAAANTWDDATNQNLFYDGPVEVSTTVATDTRNRINTVAFKDTTNSALAYTRTWYSGTKVDGYYTAIESDISFNTKYSWKTDGSTGYDFQSIALHELGHTIGLGDLYYGQYRSDTAEAMTYYSGIKHTLGNGDKTGVWTLYG